MNGLILAFIASSKGEIFKSATFENDTFTIYCMSGNTLTHEDFTKKEISDLLNDYEVNLQNEIKNKESQKQSILDRLGITEKEAKLLLS